MSCAYSTYEVNIEIDKNYILGGTGIIQNPNEVGYGYEDENVEVKRKGKTLTWKFKAENVHDFAWAADTEYAHDTYQVPDGPKLHFLYLKNGETQLWEKELPELTWSSQHYRSYLCPSF